jgi:adenine-specific DNA-methyltransferase
MPQLTWLGDDEAKRAARRVPYRLLYPVEQVGDPSSQNMLIQGVNLDALKALMPFYAGRVKCIFIDPPYNTRSAFEHYDDNLEHSQWLSMMYPRLEFLRGLLCEDGSMWITMDDNESHYLKVLLDEMFGRANFVANIIWQKTHTRENRTDVSTVHDNLLVVAKSRDRWKGLRNMLPASDAQIGRYQNLDGDPRGPWSSLPVHAKAEKGRREAQFFTVTTPSGRTVDPPPGRCWLFTQSRFQEMVADGRIWFGPSGNNAPRLKKFLNEVQSGLVPSSLWLHADSGTTGSAKSEITTLFPGQVPFSTPKPERLVERAIHIATNDGDLVLDSFLGSGTTAAVAHKMGRRWIGIEMGEHARTHCLPRLKKVVEGEQGGISEAVGWKGGGGFRYYKLGERAFEENGRIHPSIRFSALASYLWFLNTGVPHATGRFDSPLLGVHGDTAIFLLYNGILGDRRAEGGNVLTRQVLNHLSSLAPGHRGLRVVYCEASRLSASTMKNAGVEFRQIPYEIRML